MKRDFASILDTIKRTFFLDRTNLNLLLTAITITGLNYLIWKLKFADISTSLAWKLPFSPLKYFLFVILINFTAAAGTYDQEKEISHLLMGATTAISILIFTLELFLLTNTAP